ncbi:Erd1 [Schizosaccharomyces pombe]
MDLEVVEFPLHHKLALPFRIGLLVIVGTWLWSVCYHLIYILNRYQPISPNPRGSLNSKWYHLLQIPLSNRHTDLEENTEFKANLVSPVDFHAGYCFAAILSISWATGFILFLKKTQGDIGGLYSHPIYPLLWVITAFVLIVFPFPWRYRSSQRGLRKSIIRVFLFFQADFRSPYKDFIVSEIFTSYAKALGDFYIFGCVLQGHISKFTLRPDLKCDGTFFVPLAMAYPFIVAILQCLHYGLSRRKHTFKINLLNALKHATALPVIYLSAIIHAKQTKFTLTSGHGYLFWLWILSALLSSAYTFLWDVFIDWRIRFPFHKSINHKRFPMFIYAIGCFINFILRVTWSMKLHPRLHQFHEYEMGIFSFEMLEILRRFLWLFFHLDAISS